MTKILLIETATNVCSVAIAEENKLIGLKESYIDRSHAKLVAPFVAEVLNMTGLSITKIDAVAVSMGPGSYTGLRIGVSLAKGLCYAQQKPLIAVPTLEAMCYTFIDQNKTLLNISDLLLPVIDARRMEVYTATYTSDVKMIEEIHALIVEKNTFDKLVENKIAWFFGTGSEKLKEVIKHKNVRFYDKFRHTSEGMVKPAFERFKNGTFESVAYFEPFYLKDFITTTPKKKVI